MATFVTFNTFIIDPRIIQQMASGSPPLFIPIFITASATNGGVHPGNVNLNDILNQSFQQFKPQGPPPTSKKALDKLPTYEYTPEREKFMKACGCQQLDQSNCCNVCLEEYHLQDKLIQLPCQHIFHTECANPWLLEHNTCPCCRFELPVEDPEKEKQRVQRMVERFTKEGLLIMEIGSRVEGVFDKIMDIKSKLVEPLEERRKLEQMITSCDGQLMQALIELDALCEFKEERIKQQRRTLIVKIQHMQIMIDEIKQYM